MIWITALVVVAVITFLVVTYINKQNEKLAFNTYVDNLNDVHVIMLTGAANAETLLNLTGKVWFNSIYEESDVSTDKFTKHNGVFYKDFNAALTALFNDSATISLKTNIEKSQELAQPLMSALQNPPAGLEICYETVTDLYSAYISLTDLAINPSGSLTSFTQSKNEKIDTFMELYKKLETQIPAKK